MSQFHYLQNKLDGSFPRLLEWTQVTRHSRRTTALCLEDDQNHNDFSWPKSNSMNQSALCNPEMKNAT